MAETAMDAFLLPRCNKRFPQDCGKGRPCLNAHIGKCMAVCSGKISCENYNQAVKSAVHLIRYGKKDILKTLHERMMEASDRLEFETAALLRDQINAITKVTAGQKVVVDPDVEMDVVALAGTPNSVCAAVLRFREGRLTDKREFLFHDTADIAAAREEFLPRYYLDDEQIPKVIAVDELPPDSDALQQALTDKRGSEVQLYVPQRGDKAHLIEMAHTNAVERLARESGRYAREEKLLDELAQVLGLSKPPAPSKATISPTGATVPASAAWWSSGTASPTRRATGSSRCRPCRAPTTTLRWPRQSRAGRRPTNGFMSWPPMGRPARITSARSRTCC